LFFYVTIYVINLKMNSSVKKFSFVVLIENDLHIIILNWLLGTQKKSIGLILILFVIWSFL